MKNNQQFPIIINQIFEAILKEGINSNGNYPPVNVIKIDDLKFKIEIGAIGFKKEEINIQLDPSINQVTVSAKKENADNFQDDQYLQRKLSKKNFVYKTLVPDYVEITNGALEDGLLTIDFEIRKPKEKEIKTFQL